MNGSAVIAHDFTVVRRKHTSKTSHNFNEVQVMDVRAYKNTGCYYYKTLFTSDHTGHIPFLIKIFINTYCATFHIYLSYIRQQEDSTKDDATSGVNR